VLYLSLCSYECMQYGFIPHARSYVPGGSPQGHNYRSYLKFEVSVVLLYSAYNGMVWKNRFAITLFFSAWIRPYKRHSLPAETSALDLRSRRVWIQFYIWDNKSFLLYRYATYCCLILGPAALGQYLGLQPSASERVWNSKESDILSQIRQTVGSISSVRQKTRAKTSGIARRKLMFV
jgi:hypothetical protein